MKQWKQIKRHPLGRLHQSTHFFPYRMSITQSQGSLGFDKFLGNSFKFIQIFKKLFLQDLTLWPNNIFYFLYSFLKEE